ncbi:hypothetical protein ACWDZ6_10800 [Streptomyces sp. NPDC002926]
MDFMFHAVPGLIAAVAAFLGVKTIRRSLELRRAWTSGLTAEARCLRTFTTTGVAGNNGPVRTTLHHVYEFTARDGRAVRFEEANGPSTTVDGDIVVVHYSAGSPERATAQPPNPVRNAAGTVLTLAFLGLIVAFCVLFMTSYQTAFGPDTDPFSMTP